MSRKRSTSRVVLVTAIVTAVAGLGAGSAFAGSVTMTSVSPHGEPTVPNGDNGWYLQLPALKLDWVTQNSLPFSGLGYHEQVGSLANCGSYSNFGYEIRYVEGSDSPPPSSEAPEHLINAMLVSYVSPTSPILHPSCQTNFEKEQLVCFFGICQGSTAFQPDDLATVTAPLTLKVDLWDPTITAEAFGSPDGNNGWYKSNVSVRFFCSDQGSGIAADACPQNETRSQEGASVSSTAQTVTDQAGRGSLPSNTVTVKIDKTAPGVSCGATPSFVLGSSGNTVSATITDETSQPLVSTVSAAASATTLGLHTANVTGSDTAGNTRTVSCPYIVGYGYTFLQPQPNQVSQGNLGIKFQLTNAGAPISDSEAASLVAPNCKIQVSFVIGGVVNGCPTYNTSQDRFEFSVKTTKALQGANGFWVTVTVGSTVVLTTDVVPVTIK
jgi:hypothetical protein